MDDTKNNGETIYSDLQATLVQKGFLIDLLHEAKKYGMTADHFDFSTNKSIRIFATKNLWGKYINVKNEFHEKSGSFDIATSLLILLLELEIALQKSASDVVCFVISEVPRDNDSYKREQVNLKAIKNITDNEVTSITIMLANSNKN